MSAIVQAISDLWTNIIKFFNSITSVLNYIYSMLKALWYWLTSLLTWTWELIVQIFDWGVFSTVWTYFNYLASYIGYPAVIFISTLLLFIIFRIWVAFVFKILRMNIDYRTLVDKNERVEKRAKAQHK